MSSKTVRLIAVTAGVLLAMTVTTGSTQAQPSPARGGAFYGVVTSWSEPAPERVVRTPLRHQLCEEIMPDSSNRAIKG